jgi:hypothetical protein
MNTRHMSPRSLAVAFSTCAIALIASATAAASPVYTFRLADFGNSESMLGNAHQISQWTYRYPKPNVPCGFPATGKGTERIEIYPPKGLTLLKMSVGGPPVWLDLVATISRTGSYVPDLSQLGPECQGFAGNAEGFTLDHGGCGTINAIIHIGLRLVRDPRRRHRQQLQISGTFHSPLEPTLFSVCIPSPPSAIPAYSLLPTSWEIDRIDDPKNAFSFTHPQYAYRHYYGNPEGFTATWISVGLNRIRGPVHS